MDKPFSQKTPAHTRISLREIIHIVKAYPSTLKFGLAVLTLVASVSLIGALLLVITGHHTGNSPFLLLIVLLVGCTYSYLIMFLTAKETVLVERIARAHNSEFLFYQPTIHYPGSYFANGSVRIIHGLRTRHLPHFEIGNLEIVGQQSSYKPPLYGYIRIKLPRTLPHIVLSAAKNTQFDYASFYVADQKLSLEGDFDRHFSLFTPKQYERDALFIFTPDVMARFIDLAKNFSIEIIDDEMYLIANKRFRMSDPDELTQLIDLINTLLAKFNKQAHRYSDERVSSNQHNYIASQGKRLTGYNPFAIALFCLVAGGVASYTAYWLISQSVEQNNPGLRSAGVIVIVTILASGVGIIARFLQRRK